MEEFLHNRVVGQQEAIVTISKAVRRARAGLKDPKRPIGSFIFLGPTGVGKTELAKTLAEFMFGSEDHLIKIDMSEFQERHTTSRLVGSPPGYVGYGEGGQLTDAVRGMASALSLPRYCTRPVSALTPVPRRALTPVPSPRMGEGGRGGRAESTAPSS
jgi:ATP-dependent Clp protease ATP-binding subunit ClpA